MAFPTQITLQRLIHPNLRLRISGVSIGEDCSWDAVISTLEVFQVVGALDLDYWGHSGDAQNLHYRESTPQAPQIQVHSLAVRGFSPHGLILPFIKRTLAVGPLKYLEIVALEDDLVPTGGLIGHFQSSLEKISLDFTGGSIDTNKKNEETLYLQDDNFNIPKCKSLRSLNFVVNIHQVYDAFKPFLLSCSSIITQLSLNPSPLSQIVFTIQGSFYDYAIEGYASLPQTISRLFIYSNEWKEIESAVLGRKLRPGERNIFEVAFLLHDSEHTPSDQEEIGLVRKVIEEHLPSLHFSGMLRVTMG